MSDDRIIKVLVCKPGLDGHDRGAKILARALRDAGMEVIYTGLHKSPEQIVEAALQEDVDVIGLSSLSGSHMAIFPRIMELLEHNDMTQDTLVVAGGIIPDVDVPSLKKIGIEGIFGPGTDTADIVNFIRTNLNLNATKAYEYGVIEFISPSIDQLLDDIDDIKIKTLSGNLTLHTKDAEKIMYSPSLKIQILKIIL